MHAQDRDGCWYAEVDSNYVLRTACTVVVFQRLMIASLCFGLSRPQAKVRYLTVRTVLAFKTGSNMT